MLQRHTCSRASITRFALAITAGSQAISVLASLETRSCLPLSWKPPISRLQQLGATSSLLLIHHAPRWIRPVDRLLGRGLQAVLNHALSRPRPGSVASRVLWGSPHRPESAQVNAGFLATFCNWLRLRHAVALRRIGAEGA